MLCIYLKVQDVGHSRIRILPPPDRRFNYRRALHSFFFVPRRKIRVRKKIVINKNQFTFKCLDERMRFLECPVWCDRHRAVSSPVDKVLLFCIEKLQGWRADRGFLVRRHKTKHLDLTSETCLSFLRPFSSKWTTSYRPKVPFPPVAREATSAKRRSRTHSLFSYFCIEKSLDRLRDNRSH